MNLKLSCDTSTYYPSVHSKGSEKHEQLGVSSKRVIPAALPRGLTFFFFRARETYGNSSDWRETGQVLS
jgi:hypothetical protein